MGSFLDRRVQYISQKCETVHLRCHHTRTEFNKFCIEQLSSPWRTVCREVPTYNIQYKLLKESTLRIFRPSISRQSTPTHTDCLNRDPQCQSPKVLMTQRRVKTVLQERKTEKRLFCRFLSPEIYCNIRNGTDWVVKRPTDQAGRTKCALFEICQLEHRKESVEYVEERAGSGFWPKEGNVVLFYKWLLI